MRLVLTGIVFLASLLAAVVVHAPKAHAAWSAPVPLGKGHSPQVRLGDAGEFVAYATWPEYHPRAIRVLRDGRPLRTVRVPRRGRLAAFDVDAAGGVVALREYRGRKRLLALVAGRWRDIGAPGGSPVDARLAVAASGAAAAAWLQYEGDKVHVYAAVRGPNAREFGSAVRISGAVRRRNQLIAVAVDDAGDAVVTFVERRDLWMWRIGAQAVKVHDATSTVAGAYAATAAAGGGTAIVGFTHLADREPPAYRAGAATQTGEAAPVVATVAENVSELDLASDVDASGTASLITATVTRPYRIDVHRGATVTSIAAGSHRSALTASAGALAWVGGANGFAWFAGRKLTLRSAHRPDVASAGGRASVVWDVATGSTVRAARFTP